MITQLIWISFFISATTGDSLSRCKINMNPTQYFRTYGDHCYEFAIYQEVYWQEAQDLCEHKGGRLATVPDLRTQKFFAAALTMLKSERHGIWIGLHDRNSEGHYEWVSKEPVSFTYWESGSPSLFHSLEDCVIMRSTKGFHWEDQPCNLWPRHYSYICEFDMIATTTTTTTRITTTTTTTTTRSPTTTPTTTTTTTTTTKKPSTTSTTTSTTPPRATTPTTMPTTTASCPLLVTCSLDCGLLGFRTDPFSGCSICDCSLQL